MELRLLTDIKLIKKIHKEHLLKDFPENEATPWIYIKEMLRQGKYECYGAYAEPGEQGEGIKKAGAGDADFLGYAFFLKQELGQKKIYLFDYLAIIEKYRNQGVGSEFIRMLGNSITSADCIIGEVEDPLAAESEEDRELRERRLQFYQRNGYRLTSVRVRVREVDYCLLEIPTWKDTAVVDKQSDEQQTEANDCKTNAAAQFHTDEQIKEIYTAMYTHVAPEWFIKKHFQVLS